MTVRLLIMACLWGLLVPLAGTVCPQATPNDALVAVCQVLEAEAQNVEDFSREYSLHCTAALGVLTAGALGNEQTAARFAKLLPRDERMQKWVRRNLECARSISGLRGMRGGLPEEDLKWAERRVVAGKGRMPDIADAKQGDAYELAWAAEAAFKAGHSAVGKELAAEAERIWLLDDPPDAYTGPEVGAVVALAGREAAAERILMRIQDEGDVNPLVEALAYRRLVQGKPKAAVAIVERHLSSLQFLVYADVAARAVEAGQLDHLAEFADEAGGFASWEIAKHLALRGRARSAVSLCANDLQKATVELIGHNPQAGRIPAKLVKRAISLAELNAEEHQAKECALAALPFACQMEDLDLVKRVTTILTTQHKHLHSTEELATAARVANLFGDAELQRALFEAAWSEKRSRQQLLVDMARTGNTALAERLSLQSGDPALSCLAAYHVSYWKAKNGGVAHRKPVDPFRECCSKLGRLAASTETPPCIVTSGVEHSPPVVRIDGP